VSAASGISETGPGGPEGTPPDSIARNTAFALATQFTTAFFTAGLTLFLARRLGPTEFGLLAVAMGIGGVLTLPADFGVSQSAARFIAERRGDVAAVAAVFRSALQLKLIASGLVAACLFAAAGPIEDAYDANGLAWAVRGVSLALFGQSLMQLIGGSFTAMGRVALSYRMALGESVVETAATVALVLAGAGAGGAAFGRASGYLFGATVGALLAAPVIGFTRARAGRNAAAGRRQIARYAGALLIVDAAYSLFQQIDVLIIGAVLTAASAGLFQAPLRLISFLYYPAYALAIGVAPRLARQDGVAADTVPFARALRYVLIIQSFMVVPVLVWAEPIVDLLLGPDYAKSAEVLRALAPFVFLSGIGALVTMTVNYLGGARRRVPIAVIAVVLNVVLDLILIPDIGILGGAVGTDVAYGVYVPAHVVLCVRMLDFSLRPLLPTLCRALAAAAAMAGVLALLGTGDVGLPVLAAGAVAGPAVFMAVLLLTREVSLSELSEARAAVTRLLPGRAA
jgi:O-antigen/teichoic acid export membrane protein